MKINFYILIHIIFSLFLLNFFTFAQTDSTKKKKDEEDEEPVNFQDFQGEVEMAKGTKRYCTSKIFDLSPNKLISVGYDWQLPYQMQFDTENTNTQTSNVQATHGLRLAANFPIISKNQILINLGVNYLESHYNFERPTSQPLQKSLEQTALRSTGISLTIFKPLNEKNFILYSSQHDLNGDYKLDEWQPLRYVKHSIAALYGWKKHDRLQYGFGIARTYRVGEVNYIPVILYNYTATSRKWGIEALFPARAHYRKTFNPRSILLLGYELEGNSYRLKNKDGIFNTPNNTYTDLELRRSELRFRAIYETSLSGFIWLSVQAGYRINYRYNIDNGEFFRGFFGDQKYVAENSLTNPLYFLVSINLVSL
ncbi:MAG: DUF6268 family outer membrane beta-barrel protein [Microscillaceae bacterium]|nr:DUF6268 family outer membrane beta-barrel protein [Microscillaceae bacterium]MDW8461586.1 DUF6268 family outer membrane beta-barrel protein [Cytophagales bacterium]